MVGVYAFECTCCDCDCDCECSDSDEFDCDCEITQTYTVVCRGIDTAVCYGCRKENYPIRLTPRGFIQKKTNRKHSCSRCNNGKINPCPNRARARARARRQALTCLYYNSLGVVVAIPLINPQQQLHVFDDNELAVSCNDKN